MEHKTQVEVEYKQRINRVFEYIDENLETNLSLKKLAEIAFFSPFHFHRVFKYVTQETLNEYITRRRIEKSASDLLHKNISVSEIAHAYGFGDLSSFSKTFKKYFGVSPTAFQEQHPHKFSKIRQLESKNGQAYPDYDKYICIIHELKNWTKMTAKIQIKELPQMDLAYVTSMGAHNISTAYETLVQWATPHQLINSETKMISIYHDSFKITPPEKVRISASILLNKKVEITGEVGLTSIKKGKHIVGSFQIGMNEFEKSWTGLFLWMNENGYKKADQEPFEIFHNNPNEHPEGICIVDLCIPIL